MLIGLIVFLPFLIAFFSYAAGRKHECIRDNFAVFYTLAELALSALLFLRAPELRIPGILVSGLSFTSGGFRTVYSIVTSFMWAGAALFSKEYFREEREGLNGYYFFFLMTLGATQGVMLSADLMTAFIFFEILSFTSFTWVIFEETEEAICAAKTYLAIAVISGLILFMGLLLLQHAAGTLVFSEMRTAAENAENKNELFAAGALILLGFGAKAGMFPLHIWLPKAHPVAPAPASALLSGILTKVGVYGILMTSVEAFAGNLRFGILILIFGLITMALGAVLALFSVNLKRTLACSSMSQIGFVLTGIALSVMLKNAGNEEIYAAALSGSMLHMLNHSLTKLALFLAAGAVAMNLHVLTLNDIRGFGRNKPWLKLAFAIGALSISGVPFFGGYLSKTLLHEAILAGQGAYPGLSLLFRFSEWIFLFSGGLTFAYMLKLFFAVFVEKNETRQDEFDACRPCMNKESTAAVLFPALLLVLLGVPQAAKCIAAFMTGSESIMSFSPFTLENLSGTMISLAIGAAVYLLFVRKVLFRKNCYVNLWPGKLDLENLIYRPLLLRFLPFVFGHIAAVFGENKILRPVSLRMFKAGGAAAGIFGENKILRPAAKAAFYVTAFIGRIFDMSMDGLIVLTRATLLKEKKAVRGEPPKVTKLRIFRQETGDAIESVSSNFSFALFMTCLGILIILLLIFIWGRF